ncbi:nucleotidyl transferase AbiEii/AbiGii toxin family protein [Amycolatopsis anabasis]|uniref:nucleotidyl transferase AbiEii/AbiGii toxin family protein n=1 Tax=Amycolatopsis anabasis TaxID=1840409 RepID=UPI00131D56D5|nr:nucleotidyl transferase AbiEii/AbiGii toxin family protein [Amycolatopsis anabasis]
MSRPTRETLAGRRYLDLRNLARKGKRPTDELHQLYALEGFLARLAESAYADRLVLKGGVLLAAFDMRRPTRDVDLEARRVSNDVGEILAMVRTIAAVPLDDGLALDGDSATAELIRDLDAYSGVRVSLTGSLAAARLSFHVDVSVGDPIHPAPQRISLPRLLGEDHIALHGYPLPMVLAEKITTALQRGTANTRWRDFADVYFIAHRHRIDADELRAALAVVAGHRGAEPASLAESLPGYADLAQARWSAWRRRQRLEDRLPARFAEVLDALTAFADPVLTGAVATGSAWLPEDLAWTPGDIAPPKPGTS